MDTFKLNILIQNIMEGTQFSKEEYLKFIPALAASNIVFIDRLCLNLKLKRVPIINSDVELIQALRGLLPYNKY